MTQTLLNRSRLLARRVIDISLLALSIRLLAGNTWAADLVSDSVLAYYAGHAGGPDIPRGGLTQAKDGTLYGVSQNGGDQGGVGTVYQVAPDGTLTVLHSFGGPDGTGPQAGPALAKDGTRYGTTYGGGSGAPACGTVWRLTPAGVFTTLHAFACNDQGGNIDSNLVLAPDGFLYGTSHWGPTRDGLVFKLKPDGSQFAVVVNFDASGPGEVISSPIGGLMLGQDGNFYGVAQYYRDSQGAVGNALYRITAAGVLGIVQGFADPNLNEAGPTPPARDATGNLYFYGPPRDASKVPVVYRLGAGGLVVLHSFAGLSYLCPYGGGSLLLNGDGRLYGVAGCGGTLGQGFAFSLTTDGSDLQVLHNFVNDGVDLIQPNFGLIADVNGQGLWSLSGLGGPGTGVGGIYRLAPPALSLKIKPAKVAVGQPATLKWSSAETAECSASGDWAGPEPRKGSQVVTPAVPGTTHYTLNCAGAGSVAKTVSLTAK